MSNDRGARPVKLPSFKITSKKQVSPASTGPSGCVESGRKAGLAGHLSPDMATDKNAPEQGNRERKEKHQVAHVSRSRSVRENPNSGVMSGGQERCPSSQPAHTGTNKSTSLYNSDALITWIESYQQSLPEARVPHGAEPLSKADVNERYVSSFLRKMELFDTKQTPAISNVGNKKTVAFSSDLPTISQPKQRAQSEPVRSRNLCRRRHNNRLPEDGKKSRNKKSSRASSEHRCFEPTTVDPPDKPDIKPQPSTHELIVPQILPELDSADKNNTKSGHSHKRKNKSKRTKAKNIQPSQSNHREQLVSEAVGSICRDNREAPEQTRDSSQQRASGFRFGNLKKKSSKPRDLPRICEDPADRSVIEEKSFTNQQSGDEASVPKRKSQKTDDLDELFCRREFGNSQELDNGQTQDRCPSATDMSKCGSETRVHRRKSSNLCLKKKATGARRVTTAGGNFFQNFADAVGSQLSSIACRNQRLYRFPGIQGLYTPDVDLTSMYQPYDPDEECEDEAEHTAESKSPRRSTAEERLSQQESDKKQSVKSESGKDSEYQSVGESEFEGSTTSERSEVVIASSISISSRGSDDMPGTRETPGSGAVATPHGSSQRQISMTSSVKASTQSSRTSKKSPGPDDRSRTSKKSSGPDDRSRTSKKSSGPDDRSRTSLPKSSKGESLKSIKSSLASETRQSTKSSTDSKKSSLTKRASVESPKRRDDSERTSSRLPSRGTPAIQTPSERSSKVKQISKRGSLSSRASLKDLPESDQETSVVKSSEKRTPTITYSDVKSPHSQQKTSREVLETDDRQMDIEMEQSVSIEDSHTSTDSPAGAPSSKHSPKGYTPKDGSSQRSLEGSASHAQSKTSYVASQTIRSKQSSGIFRDGKQTPDSRKETPKESEQLESLSGAPPPERVASTAGSNKTQPTESARSFAPSERQKMQESKRSSASQDRRSPSRSDIAQSPAKSDRLKTPESQHADRAPPLDIVCSPGDRAPPCDSKISIAISDAYSGTSKAGVRSTEGVQSVIISDGSYIIDATQTVVVSGSASTSEYSSSETSKSGREPSETRQTWDHLESKTEQESRQNIDLREDTVLPESIHSTDMYSRSHIAESPHSMGRSGRSQVSQDYQDTTQRLQEIPDIVVIPERTPDSSRDRTRSPSKGESASPYRDRTRSPSKGGSASPYTDQEINEMLARRSDLGSKQSGELTPRAETLVSTAPSARLTPRAETLVSTALSDRMQEMAASIQSVTRSERTQDSLTERTATSSKTRSPYPSTDRDDAEIPTRRSDTGSKQSYRTVDKPETVSKTSVEILQQTPLAQSMTASERTLHSLQDVQDSPSTHTPRSPYIDREGDEVLRQRSLPGSKMSYGSSETTTGSANMLYKTITERDSASEDRKSVRLSQEQVITTESSSSSGKQQVIDASQFYSTSEYHTGPVGRSSADTSQIMKISERESRQKSADGPTPKMTPLLYADSTRSTPARIEQLPSLGDHRRDYKQVLTRETTDMDACKRILSERKDVCRGKNRDTRTNDGIRCCCADCGVHQVKIIMKTDSSDCKSSCSCIQVCSSLRPQADCMKLKALDCKKECPSSEHTESETYDNTAQKNDESSRLPTRAQRSHPTRDERHESHPRDKCPDLSRTYVRSRYPCESILKGYSTDAGRSFPGERQSQRHQTYPGKSKERRTHLYDTSTPEKSFSSHFSDSRSATNQYSRPYESSRSEHTPRAGRAGESVFDKSWRQDPGIYGDYGHDDFQVTSSEKPSRFDINDEWEDSSHKEAVENTTDFDTSHEMYDRGLSDNGRRTVTRTTPSKHSSPRSKPSRQNTPQITTGQGRVIEKYEKKCGDNYITVTSSNLSTSSKSDCSNLQVTVKSCKDRMRKLHKDRKLSNPDARLDYNKPSRPAMAGRYSPDYLEDADAKLPSRKEKEYGDYYSTERPSGGRLLPQADQPASRESRRHYETPIKDTLGRASSRDYKAVGGDDGDEHTGRQRGDELCRSTTQATRRSGSVLPSRYSVRFPCRCDDTSSDTSSLPAVRDDHMDSRCRRIDEYECRQRRQPCRPLAVKCDTSDDTPVRKSLSSSGRDKRRIHTNLHLTARPVPGARCPSPCVDVKMTSSRSSQDISSMERQVRAKIQRRSPPQRVQGLQAGNTGDFDRLLSCHSSGTGASTSDDVKSQNTTSPSPDDLDCEFSEHMPGDQADKRAMRRRQKARECCDVKKLRGRITFRCSDCGSGRPHVCKCKDAKVAIQKGKVKVVATPSGGRMIGCDKSSEHLASRKSHMYTPPAVSTDCSLRRKKCLESFLSDSCMDRYEPECLNYKTRYGLASNYCDTLRLPSHRPFSHNYDFWNRRGSGHRSRSSYHIPNTRLSTHTSRLYDRPPAGSRRHDLPHNVVSVGCRSRSNSASPSPLSWMEAPEVIDPFEQIVTPQLPFSYQDVQQMHAYQNRKPTFGQVCVNFEKSTTTATPSSQSTSSRRTNSFYASSATNTCSHAESVAKPQVYGRARQRGPRSPGYTSPAPHRTLTGDTSPSTHPRTIPPPRDIVPRVYIESMARARSVSAALRPSHYDPADGLQLRPRIQCSPSPQSHRRETRYTHTSRVLSPARPMQQSLRYSASNSHVTSGSSDVELWTKNKNFSSSVVENKTPYSGSKATRTRAVSPEVIDNLNLWATDPVWPSLSPDTSQSLDTLPGPGDVVGGGNLLQLAQYIPPLPVAQFGDQTLDMIRRNSQKAALYARQLLASWRSFRSPCSQCRMRGCRDRTRSPSHGSWRHIRYILVEVSSSSDTSSEDYPDSESMEGQRASPHTNSSGVNVSAATSHHEEMIQQEMSAPPGPDTGRESADEAQGRHIATSACRISSTYELDQITSPSSSEPIQELNDGRHGIPTPNEDLEEAASSCQSLPGHANGFDERAAVGQADPGNVTLSRAQLSLEEEHTLRCAIDRTLHLYQDFTLIPLYYTESTRTTSSMSSRDPKSTQQRGSNTGQYPATIPDIESNTGEYRSEIPDMDSSKNNFDTFRGHDEFVCNPNDKKIKIYIISSERQKHTHTEEEIYQNVSSQHACPEPTTPHDICHTVLGSRGCSVEVFGQTYQIFTIDELISATRTSKIGQGQKEHTAEIYQREQQYETVGQQISDTEEDMYISDADFGQDCLTTEITIKETGEVQRDADKFIPNDNSEDDKNDGKHLCSHQFLTTTKWSCLAPDDGCFIYGNLLDRNLSASCSAGVAPDLPAFLRNRGENVNNSLASPPSNSQTSISCRVPPQVPEHGDSCLDDRRNVPTMQQSSSWTTGEFSRCPNMPSQHVEMSSCDVPSHRRIWNYRRSPSRQVSGDYESGVNYELSPELGGHTEMGRSKMVIKGNPDFDNYCSTQGASHKQRSGQLTVDIGQQTLVGQVTDMATLDTASLQSCQILVDSPHSREVDIYSPHSREVDIYSPHSREVDIYSPHSREVDIYSPQSREVNVEFPHSHEFNVEFPHSHELNVNSLCSRDERCKEVDSDNDNTCVTFMSLSSECVSCISRSRKSTVFSDVHTDLSSAGSVRGDTTLATQHPTYTHNPFGLLEVLISGKLKVIFDKALERWMSPSHRKCYQLTRGGKSSDGKAMPQSELQDSLSSAQQTSGSSGQPQEDDQDTSVEFFTTVGESLSEKSVTEESFVLLSLPAESESASAEKGPLPETGLNCQGVSELPAHETDPKAKKSGPKEKYVLSVKKKRIVSEKRRHKNKEQEKRDKKRSAVSSCNNEHVWSESNIESGPSKSEPSHKVKAATDELTDTHQSPVWTRSMTSSKSSPKSVSVRQESESKVRVQSVHKSVVSSSRKQRSVSSLRRDRARPRRRHEHKASRTPKHAHSGGEQANREVTIQIICSGKADATSRDGVSKTPKSCSSSGTSDVDRTHASSLKSEQHSCLGAECHQHSSRKRDKSPGQSCRSNTLGTYTDRQDCKTDSKNMDCLNMLHRELSQPPREYWKSPMYREMNKLREDKANDASLHDHELFRRSHAPQGQQLRTAAIHNNMRINWKCERQAKGIDPEDPCQVECINPCILTPIKEESVSQDSSDADKSKFAADKSKSDAESLIKDISDALASHTNESFTKSKNSNDSSRSMSSHQTSSQRSISAQRSRHGEESVDLERNRVPQRDRSSCSRHYKDTDCQTDEHKAHSSDSCEDFLAYLQNRCPFKSAFLRQEMKGFGHWSVPSRGSSTAKNEDELLRTYAGGGSSSSSYSRTGKLDLNTFWYRKMRNINMNWTESDTYQVLASSLTDLSPTEAPVSAVTDSHNWTPSTGQVAARCSSTEPGRRSAELSHMTALLNDHLANEGTGHLAFHRTSIEPGCTSGELNYKTTLLNDHLANEGTGHLVFGRKSTEPGCTGGELTHKKTLLNDHLVNEGAGHLPCRHSSVESSYRCGELNHKTTLLNDHLANEATGHLAFHKSSMESSYRCGDLNHKTKLLSDHLVNEDIRHLTCHHSSMESSYRCGDLNHKTTSLSDHLGHGWVATCASRIATSRHTCPTFSRRLPGDICDIRPPVSHATTREWNTNANNGNDEFSADGSSRQAQLQAGEHHHSNRRLSVVTINIQPARHVTRLPNACIYVQRKPTRGRPSKMEILNGHLKNNHLVLRRKLLFSSLDNGCGNCNIFHGNWDVSRINAQHNKRICPNQHGQNGEKRCQLQKCRENDRRIRYCRENDRRRTRLKYSQHN